MNTYIETVRKEINKMDYHRCNTRNRFIGYVIYKPDEDLGWDGLTFTNEPPRFLIFNTEDEGIEYMKSKAQENGDFYHIFHFAEVAKLSVYSTLKIGKEKIFGINPEISEEGFLIDRIYDGNY